MQVTKFNETEMHKILWRSLFTNRLPVVLLLKSNSSECAS